MLSIFIKKKLIYILQAAGIIYNNCNILIKLHGKKLSLIIHWN